MVIWCRTSSTARISSSSAKPFFNSAPGRRLASRAPMGAPIRLPKPMPISAGKWIEPSIGAVTPSSGRRAWKTVPKAVTGRPMVAEVATARTIGQPRPFRKGTMNTPPPAPIRAPAKPMAPPAARRVPAESGAACACVLPISIRSPTKTKNAAKILRNATPGSQTTTTEPSATPSRLNGTMRLTTGQSTLPRRLCATTEPTDPMVTIPIEVASATTGASATGTPRCGSAKVSTGTAISAMPTPIIPSSRPPRMPAAKSAMRVVMTSPSGVLQAASSRPGPSPSFAGRQFRRWRGALA